MATFEEKQRLVDLIEDAGQVSTNDMAWWIVNLAERCDALDEIEDDLDGLTLQN